MPSNYLLAKRFHIFILAAFSITILLFTIVVHSRHLVPSHRFPTHPGSVMGGGFMVEEDCGGLFYADEVLRCVETRMEMERKKSGGLGIGSGEERKKGDKFEEERERGGRWREEGEKDWL